MTGWFENTEVVFSCFERTEVAELKILVDLLTGLTRRSVYLLWLELTWLREAKCLSGNLTCISACKSIPFLFMCRLSLRQISVTEMTRKEVLMLFFPAACSRL